jgi:hypothetical protein
VTAPRRWRSTLAMVLYGVAVAGFATCIVSFVVPGDPGSQGIVDLLGVIVAFLVYATVEPTTAGRWPRPQGKVHP